VEEQPPVWFHDVLYPDGRPYREREAEILRRETGRGRSSRAFVVISHPSLCSGWGTRMRESVRPGPLVLPDAD